MRDLAPNDPARLREELGGSTRRCRDRMRPVELGLASIGRRRALGLGREELSVVAGVGLTGLTLVGRGRDINASTEALLALSRRLPLSDDEQT